MLDATNKDNPKIKETFDDAVTSFFVQKLVSLVEKKTQ